MHHVSARVAVSRSLLEHAHVGPHVVRERSFNDLAVLLADEILKHIKPVQEHSPVHYEERWALSLYVATPQQMMDERRTIASDSYAKGIAAGRKQAVAVIRKRMYDRADNLLDGVA
jgi:hypothetical protein